MFSPANFLKYFDFNLHSFKDFFLVKNNSCLINSMIQIAIDRLNYFNFSNFLMESS